MELEPHPRQNGRMRLRTLTYAGALSAVVLVLGALLVSRLVPSSASDGKIEPVVISPAGLTQPSTSETSAVSPGPGHFDPTETPTSPDATTPETSARTAPPVVKSPTSPRPSQVKPTPKPVDDDDDDDDDDAGANDDDDDDD